MRGTAAKRKCGAFTIITSENRSERPFKPPMNGHAISMKATLHTLECDEKDLIELPDTWIPVRLEHNSYATPNRKAYTLYYLVQA
jgi:hypothetical protein